MRLSAGDFLAKTLNFLAFVYLARILGVVNFGVLEFANTLLTYFLLLADAGFEIWGTREAALTQDVRELAGRVVPLRFAAAGMAALLLLATLPALPEAPQLKLVLAVFGLDLFAQAASLKWLLMGREKMSQVAAGLVVAQIAFAVAVFATIRGPEGILWVPVLRFLSDLVLAAYFARQFAAAHGGLRMPLSFKNAWGTLRPALTMGATNAMGLLNFNFDSLLLGFLKGTATVGLYNAAYKPVVVALALPVTYFTGLFPALSRLYAESREKFDHLVVRSLRLCAIFGLPIGIGGTLLAAPAIEFLFGKAYAESAMPFRILVWSAVFVILRGSYRHSLNAAGHQRLDFGCAVLSASLNVGLNIALIPRYGMVGAACATVFADIVWLVLAIYFFHRCVSRLNPWPILARPIFAGMAMAATLWYSQKMFWITSGVLGALVYFTVLAVLQEPGVRFWQREPQD